MEERVRHLIGYRKLLWHDGNPWSARLGKQDTTHRIALRHTRERSNGETLGIRGSRRALERLANLFSILLMFQFVSHSTQQMRQAKGLLEGLPCPEEFRDIQDISFSSYA
jgi:hypothetical protein